MWEVSLPPSPVEFSSHHHFYKLSRSKVAGQVLPLLPYLQFHEGLPYPLFSSQGSLPSLLHVFFVVFVYYSVWFFSLFSLGGGQSADVAQGCLW
jgi:hypothetical protein